MDQPLKQSSHIISSDKIQCPSTWRLSCNFLSHLCNWLRNYVAMQNVMALLWKPDLMHTKWAHVHFGVTRTGPDEVNVQVPGSLRCFLGKNFLRGHVDKRDLMERKLGKKWAYTNILSCTMRRLNMHYTSISMYGVQLALELRESWFVGRTTSFNRPLWTGVIFLQCNSLLELQNSMLSLFFFAF